MALQPDERSTQEQARAIIERQLTQLTRLVDDLLDVARVSSGRVNLQHDYVCITNVVDRAVDTARHLFAERGHSLSISPPSEAIWLIADAARLEQIVVNLLANAAKYTENAGQIWLSVERVADACVLRVKDTGVGIAPELLPRIFDLFTQADQTKARSKGGLGIGLALVQRLVDMHQGQIEVRSTLGRGSEFVVTLPGALSSDQLPLASGANKKFG